LESESLKSQKEIFDRMNRINWIKFRLRFEGFVNMSPPNSHTNEENK
jgi:hypothetical protein